MLILNSDDLSISRESRDSREWISDVKFSPDGKTFGMGSQDNKIYLYDVERSFALKAKCEMHNSFITHFDFSRDSDYIQSNCGGFELLFSKVTDGGNINSPSTLKDVEWATFTCTLGWPVQGIWSDMNDGVRYNAVDRNNSETLVATADNFGHIKVYRYPCLTKDAAHAKGTGHSANVQNLKFNKSDEFLVSIGGKDRAVLQWRVVKSKTAPASAGQGSAAESKEQKK